MLRGSISPEKLKLYERLQQAETQAVRTHQAFLPPELEELEERVAYRRWRRINHYQPKVERALEYARQRATERPKLISAQEIQAEKVKQETQDKLPYGKFSLPPPVKKPSLNAKQYGEMMDKALEGKPAKIWKPKPRATA